MVVIEPVSSSDHHQNTDTRGSGGGNKSTTAGYTSDGYETASETEVGDDEAVSGDTNKQQVVESEHQQLVSEEASAVSKDQLYEDALNDDELKQVHSFFLSLINDFVSNLGFWVCFLL